MYLWNEMVRLRLTNYVLQQISVLFLPGSRKHTNIPKVLSLSIRTFGILLILLIFLQGAKPNVWLDVTHDPTLEIHDAMLYINKT